MALKKTITRLDLLKMVTEESKTNRVQLYIYDLLSGWSRKLAETLLGRKFEGFWHTSIVIFGIEYHFGREGIISSKPGESWFGTPKVICDLGTTTVTPQLLHMFLYGLKKWQFTPDKYKVFGHNCNTFSNELAQFLVGRSLPTNIMELPYELMISLIQTSVLSIFCSEEIRDELGIEYEQASTSQRRFTII